MAAKEEQTSAQDVAQDLCQRLWDIGAVAFDLERGFTLADGSVSPVYFNIRLLFGHPDVRSQCLERLANLYQHIGPANVDVVAGGETAGIPLGAWLADRFEQPFVYVRKRPKGYGNMAQVEGLVDLQDQRVLLVEDLIRGGGSKRLFLTGLRQAGAQVAHCLVVFDRQQGGRQALEAAGVDLHAVADMDAFLAFLKGRNRAQWDALQSYLQEQQPKKGDPDVDT